MNAVVSDRGTNPFDARIGLIEFTLQGVEFDNDFLDLDDDGAYNPQIPRAMFADDRLILDRFGAERTFHQADRFFLRRMSVSSSLFARSSSRRSVSRWCASSLRSASSDWGTAISREQ
jgi:hypothetical protein